MVSLTKSTGGFRQNPPETLPTLPSLLARRQPIDAEALIGWALSQSGRLPWQNASRLALDINDGLTARPRRRQMATRAEFEAQAGMNTPRTGLVTPPRRPSRDALRVISAIMALGGATASLVVACGHSGIRPNWLPGVEPRQVPIVKRNGRRHKKGHRPIIVMVWKPCEPAAIRAAREAYRRWHGGVAAVARAVDGALDAWEISGFAAPAEPWRVATAAD